jgi:hypothetical protein
MRPDDLRRFLQQRPFKPFRFYVLETTVYEVRHPEGALVSRSTVTLDLRDPTDSSPLAKGIVIIALLHITRLEMILPAAPPLTNGA